MPELTNGRRWYGVIDTSLKSGENFLDAGEKIRVDPLDYYLANLRRTVVRIGKWPT